MILEIEYINNLTSDIWEMKLNGDFPFNNVQAGQFINIRIKDSYDHLLRRPISIAEANTDMQSLTIVFRVVGQGTKWLSQRQKGDKLDVMGPLGVGFPLPDYNRKVLIVGGGVGVPPLYQLAVDVSKYTKNVHILLGFRNARECFWQEKFADKGELVIATEDGSRGVRGFVTDALKAYKSYWDYVYACGPRPMLKALKQYFQGQDVKGYVSLEERMACGVGACYGCVCSSEDRGENFRICKEGPVFPWGEVDI
ncbi:MAG: dihydroorotate dehydrogenase electron transfer subunit [Firmicutes bacterium]|nr:dihydroorotate dehydrogenase electron transfer subunit [Bacillota bacterium]